MAKIRLYIYPPLSYKMMSKRVGALVLAQSIGHGETLGDLLARLTKSNQEAWQAIFDTRTRRLRPVIIAPSMARPWDSPKRRKHVYQMATGSIFG